MLARDNVDFARLEQANTECYGPKSVLSSSRETVHEIRMNQL